jgi:hypothetical protein
MSALGQKQTSRHVRVMSAIPLKADVRQRDWRVRYVPLADIHVINAATLRAPGLLPWMSSFGKLKP